MGSARVKPSKSKARDESFWDAVAENAQRMGPPVTLLTEYDPIGAILSRWTNSPPDRRPADRRIEYVQGHPSGGGTGYVGTVDGVEVFSADVEDGHSYLFSARCLNAVSYRLVTPDAFVTAEFEEGDNPWSGTIVVRFAQMPHGATYPLSIWSQKTRWQTRK